MMVVKNYIQILDSYHHHRLVSSGCCCLLCTVCSVCCLFVVIVVGVLDVCVVDRFCYGAIVFRFPLLFTENMLNSIF